MKGKRIEYIIIIGMVFLLLMSNAAFGEEATNVYNCQMQLTYSDGGNLPPAPLTVDDLQKKLKLEVTNGLDVSDQFMLLCFLDGKLLPYEVDGVQYTNKHYKIDGASKLSIEFALILDESAICNNSVLYIMTVGLLDKAPKNSMDYYELFSCSIPIVIHTSTNTVNLAEINNLNWTQIPTNSEESQDMYVYYPFSLSDVISELGKSLLYGTTDNGFEFHLIAKGDNKKIAICLFVDNQPYPLDNDIPQPTIVSTAADCLYLHTTNLQLPEGAHSIYCVYMSLDNQNPRSWNTNKLSLIIK